MKSTHPYRPRDLSQIDIMINEERRSAKFMEAFSHQIWKAKKNKASLFVSFRDWMINAISWNKLKLARCKGIYFRDMADHRLGKQFWNIISLCFLAEEGILQICYWS